MSEHSRSSDLQAEADGAVRQSWHRRSTLALFAVLLLTGLGAKGLLRDASAQTARLLDAPRAAGQVGERYDGYAVTRGNVPADVAALVQKVNGERKALYAQRAASEHVPIEAIGKIYAAQIIQSAPPGTWFLAESGQWSQK